MKIRPVGAELFHADGRTDGHDEAKSRLRNFSNAPKNRWAISETENTSNECHCNFQQLTIIRKFTIVTLSFAFHESQLKVFTLFECSISMNGIHRATM